MIGLILDLLASLVPDFLDDWIQRRLDRVPNKHLRRFLRGITWLLCALLELAIAAAVVIGIGYLILRLLGIL